jgi:hypothetical protein
MISPAAFDEREVISGLDDDGYFRVAPVRDVLDDMERAGLFLDEFPDFFQVGLAIYYGRILLPWPLGRRGDMPAAPGFRGLIRVNTGCRCRIRALPQCC